MFTPFCWFADGYYTGSEICFYAPGMGNGGIGAVVVQDPLHPLVIVP